MGGTDLTEALQFECDVAFLCESHFLFFFARKNWWKKTFNNTHLL